MYQMLEAVFQWLSKHLEFHQLKNTLLHIIFSTLFSVFGYRSEILSFVFDKLLQSDVIYNLLTQAFSLVQSDGPTDNY